MIDRNPKYKSHIFQSTYCSMNRIYPAYDLDAAGYDVLKQKYSMRNAGNSIGNEYRKIISDIFTGVEVVFEKQFLCGKYRVDIFIPDLNMIIEIDEKEHCQKVCYDKKRRTEIISEFTRKLKEEDEECGIVRKVNFDYSSWVSFITIKEGELGTGIREIMLEIERITMQTPVMYMK